MRDKAITKIADRNGTRNHLGNSIALERVFLGKKEQAETKVYQLSRRKHGYSKT
jgi:hypothetical protein